MAMRKYMRVPRISTIAMLALIAAGCNSGESTNGMSTEANLTDDAAANDVLGADGTAADRALPTDAQGFATAVAASDLYEIESSRLALQKSASAGVKEIAQMLVREHQASSAQLRTAAQAAGVTVAPALDSEKQGMVDALRAASGDEFDQLYMSQQRLAHAKSLMLLQSYAQSGDNEALKQFASKTQAAIEFHIDRINAVSQ